MENTHRRKQKRKLLSHNWVIDSHRNYYYCSTHKQINRALERNDPDMNFVVLLRDFMVCLMQPGVTYIIISVMSLLFDNFAFMIHFHALLPANLCSFSVPPNTWVSIDFSFVRFTKNPVYATKVKIFLKTKKKISTLL